MVSDISRQGRHHRHVRLYLPIESRDRFMQNVPAGFMVRLYAPQPADPRQFVDKNEVNITVVVNENEPEPSLRRYDSDINTYLNSINTIDSRIKILSDSVSKNDQPDLLDDWFIKNEVMLNHPGLDGELDHLRSNAANIKNVEVTESQLHEMESHYEGMKKDFIRTKLTDAKKTRKLTAEKEKVYTLQQGEI